MKNQQAFEQPSTAVNVTVRQRRPREYLTEREIERLIQAADDNRWGHRDATACEPQSWSHCAGMTSTSPPAVSRT
jgi:hypothetical protein